MPGALDIFDRVRVWIHALHPVLDFSRKPPKMAEQSAMEGAWGEKSELKKEAAIC